MTRERVRELADVNATYVLQYCGPIETGERFCQEGAPTDIEACGFLTDMSEWIYERINVEPDWRMEQDQFGNWKVWAHDPRLWEIVEKGLPPTWHSVERARAYLQLLQDDWWGRED